MVYGAIRKTKLPVSISAIREPDRMKEQEVLQKSMRPFVLDPIYVRVDKCCKRPYAACKTCFKPRGF